jgi:RNA polymerase sigma-70 factor (ECF subfamily)
LGGRPGLLSERRLAYSLTMAEPASTVHRLSALTERIGSPPVRERRGGLVGVDGVPSLVERARGRDREAFAELYRFFHAALFRLARFHLGPGAEDAVSETFLRAWKALPQYRSTGAPFGAWLYGIARHVVADQRNAMRREEPRSTLPDRASDPTTVERLTLMRAIEGLPKTQRYVIEAKFLVGLTNGELAAALGKSTGAINALQWRALRALQRMLEDR